MDLPSSPDSDREPLNEKATEERLATMEESITNLHTPKDNTNLNKSLDSE